MSHKFINIDTPNFIINTFSYFSSYKDIITCKQCSKCNLLILNELFIKDDGEKYSNDWFYINEVEIYLHIEHEDDLLITCDELIIKNILE